MTDWEAISANQPISASIALPGSKSLSNRELILCALADSPSTLRGVLDARDTQLMIEGLRSFGVQIEETGRDSAGNLDLDITPHFLRASPSSPTVINVGLAGTVMRFLPPVAAFARGDSYFDGDQAALRLQKMVAQLPEKQRIVFNMKYFDNMNYEAMSEILDTSVGALKASYHHAVKKIKNELND